MTATAANSARDEKIRNFLQRQNLRAWIAWRPDELVMMTGCVPHWGASLLVYFDDVDPLLFVPPIEPREFIPPGLPVRDYPWGVLNCAEPYSFLLTAAAEELQSGIRREQVGTNRSSARSALPIQAAEQIPFPENFSEKISALAGQSDAAQQSAFLELYLRKTPEDIHAIRLANRIANIGLKVFFEHLQPGMSEVQVASAVESAIQCQTGREDIFHSRGWAMVQSGPNTADAGRFNRSTGRRLENGDPVLIELATCVNGYWSDLTRTAVVGCAIREAEKILTAVTEARRAPLDVLQPGISAGEIDAAAWNKVADHGFSAFFTHPTGHHVVFRYHDPGFAIAPRESASLEPGMVITIEPGVYVKDHGAGARIEDNVLLTESGYEVLSRIERSNTA